MLSKFSTAPRKLPRQPKLGKNTPKLHRFQFCARYGDNFCVYGRVLEVGEFKYAIWIFQRTNEVAMSTKSRQK